MKKNTGWLLSILVSSFAAIVGCVILMVKISLNLRGVGSSNRVIICRNVGNNILNTQATYADETALKLREIYGLLDCRFFLHAGQIGPVSKTQPFRANFLQAIIRPFAERIMCGFADIESSRRHGGTEHRILNEYRPPSLDPTKFRTKGSKSTINCD